MGTNHAKILHLITKGHLLRIALLMLISFLYNCSIGLLPFTFQYLIDHYSTIGQSNLIFVLIAYGGLLILLILLGYLDMRIAWRIDEKLSYDLKRRIIVRIIKHGNIASAIKVSYLENDVDSAVEAIDHIIALVRSILGFAIYFCFSIAMIGPYYASLMLTIYGCILRIVSLENKQIAINKTQSMIAIGTYMDQVKDLLRGIRKVNPLTFTSFSQYHTQQARLEQNKKYQFNHLKSVQEVKNDTGIMIGRILVLAILLGNAVSGNISIGLFVSCYQITSYLFELVDSLIQSYMHANAEYPCLIRIYDLIQNDIDRKKPMRCFDKEIIVNQVSSKCLQNLNFQINKGDKIWIEGENGSGKSTFIHLLSKYSDNYTGTISFDGFDYSKIEIGDVIASAYHSSKIYSANFIDNITIFHSYDNALPKLISDLPTSLQMLANRLQDARDCSVLSGGEKQVILLFRMLCANKPVVLIDETFANLDQNTYQDVIQLLTSLPITLLVIGHKQNASAQMRQGFNRVVRFVGGVLYE